MHPAHQRIPYLPARIEGLAQLSLNLWWSWSKDARGLFRTIDPAIWHQTRHNPLALLRRVDPARLAHCASDTAFVQHYDRVMAAFAYELEHADTWFAKACPNVDPAHPVAYFCAEFGLHNSVPIYSGGLGVLAGDHCKAVSDLGVPMVGVGLLYTKGYFDQRIRADGWQEDSDDAFDIDQTPILPLYNTDGSRIFATVQTAGRPVHVTAWKMEVGRMTVYLLDTDLEENRPDDRQLLNKLYAGGQALRVRQEWILGIGGVRVLRALGIAPGAWHANEGHAAFMHVERLRELRQTGVPLHEALATIRKTSIFTTHTPVPAGHDKFPVELLESVTGPAWDDLGISREEFLGLGLLPEDAPNVYHMTAVAIGASTHINGVSRRHGAVSRQLWQHMWPGRPMDAVPIGHITNGVHLQTWMASPVMRLLDEHLGAGWLDRLDDGALWDKVLTLDHTKLWDVHVRLKTVLANTIREEARRRFSAQLKEASQVVGAGTLLDPNVLTVGFARRFATYKRANLLFSNLERMRRLCTNAKRPVQFIFAGKAHPEDRPGKEVLKDVYAFTRDPAFEGRIAFLEDYDMHLAHLLVQGVDLWMNMPRVPLEASGTSGMKAGLNGVPQLSTLDGWWQEGYDGLAGWAVPPTPEGEDVDAHDADKVYRLLEDQIAPLYYTRDSHGVPVGWVERMRHAVRLSGSMFTSQRMVTNYVQAYYAPALRQDRFTDDPPTI